MMKRQILASSLLAASTVATLSLLTSAQAASLNVRVHCDSTGPGAFLCDAFASAGSGSYRFSWNTGRNAQATRQRNNGSKSTIFGTCKIGTKPRIKVTARDSSGVSITRSASFKCASVAL